MAAITDFHTPWRDKYKRARFREAEFFTESDLRAGGRRVVTHEYPKRNTPYSEDMGRAAIKFQVQGFLIGRDYLVAKDNLVSALEMDGPGMLRLPLQYMMSDVKVMVQSYTVTESRERGGFCVVDMGFVEYGDPVWRDTISTSGEIQKSASAVEDTVIGNSLKGMRSAVPYAKVYQRVFGRTSDSGGLIST
jgi:prophage DNA circulation protein